MTERTLRGKATKLADVNAQISALQKQAERLKADITDEMRVRNVDELRAGNNLIRWKLITSMRFDSANFKEEHAALYDQFSTASTTRRFTLVPA